MPNRARAARERESGQRRRHSTPAPTATNAQATNAATGLDKLPVFVRGLRKLRPGYEFVAAPPAAAAAGVWRRRAPSPADLAAVVQAFPLCPLFPLPPDPFPPEHPHAPTFADEVARQVALQAMAPPPPPPPPPEAPPAGAADPLAGAGGGSGLLGGGNSESGLLGPDPSPAGGDDDADGGAGAEAKRARLALERTPSAAPGDAAAGAAGAAGSAAASGSGLLPPPAPGQPHGDTPPSTGGPAATAMTPAPAPAPSADAGEGGEAGGSAGAGAGTSAAAARPLTATRRSARSKPNMRYVSADGAVPGFRLPSGGGGGSAGGSAGDLAASADADAAAAGAPTPEQQQQQQQPPQPQYQLLSGGGRRGRPPKHGGRGAGAAGAKRPLDPTDKAAAAALAAAQRAAHPRHAHNDAVRRAASAAELVRARHLLGHLDKLRPFITPQAEAALVVRARGAPPAPAVPPPSVLPQPSRIRGEMREYQLEGLAWMAAQYERGMNAILADEMGLGKTLQSIAFLAHLKWERGVPGPHLVVVPLSVLASWVNEFKRWCPDMRVVRLHATDDDERRRLKRDVLSDPAQFDVAVTTYDMVNSAHFGGALKSTLVWRYLVLDEGHKIKNEATLTCQGMRAVSRQHVLLLTGTPLQNSMRELYVLLNFLYPDVFTDGAPFDGAFDPQRHKVDDSRLAQAHYLLRPLCLRRLKEEVEQRLPAKVETRISCPLSEYQTFWYRRLLTRDAKLLERIEKEALGGNVGNGGGGNGGVGAGAGGSGGGGGGENGGDAGGGGGAMAAAAATAAPASADGSAWQRLMNLVMQLRKVVDHPFLFPDSEPEGGAGLEEVVEASGEKEEEVFF